MQTRTGVIDFARNTRTATLAAGTASAGSVQQEGRPSESSAVQVNSFALPTSGLWVGAGVALNQAGEAGELGWNKAQVSVNGKVVTSDDVLRG